MSNDSAAIANQLIERVRALAPAVDEHRSSLHRERGMPDELTAQLIEAQLFRLWTPRDLGGLELDPVSGLRVMSEVARLDGSVGWNVMLLATYSAFAGHLPPDAARQIFEPPDAAVAGQITRAGAHARVVDSGYQVTGRWPFGSGSGQATWFVSTCAVEEDEPAEDSRPQMIWAFTPAANCEIHDTWHTGGLRGTASHDYSMSDVFVPEDFVIRLPATRPMRDEALYRLPLSSLLFPAVASVLLGIARAAIDDFIELSHEKRARRSDLTYAEREVVQIDVSRAENLVGAARALLFEAVGDVWDAIQRDKPPTLRQRGRVRAASSHVGSSCVEAVEIVYRHGGASSIFESRRLERCLRDVLTARQHAAVSDRPLITSGRVFLGDESSDLQALV